MKFKPLQDRVLVRRAESKSKSPGGIIITETAKQKPQVGEVIEVGEGARNDRGDIIPMSVKVGDNIVFGKYDGVELALGDEKLLIMKEADIFGIL